LRIEGDRAKGIGNFEGKKGFKRKEKIEKVLTYALMEGNSKGATEKEDYGSR